MVTLCVQDACLSLVRVCPQSLCDWDVCVARDIHTNDHKQTWSKSRHITIDIHKGSRHALSKKACMFPGHALIIHTEQFIEEKRLRHFSDTLPWVGWQLGSVPFPWLGEGKLHSLSPASPLTATRGSSRPRGPGEESLGPPAPARVTRGTHPISQPSTKPVPPTCPEKAPDTEAQEEARTSEILAGSHSKTHPCSQAPHTLVFSVLPGGRGREGL